jgi:5-amino-6-(5-phosphoribosylamino)uracil reductase
MEVFSNSAMSLDGRLGTARFDHLRLGSDEDLRRMVALRGQADGVLVGGRTWRAWDLPLVGPAGRTAPLVNAVLTRTGAGPRGGRFFASAGTRPVILGDREADLDGFPPGTHVHRAPGPATVGWALSVLEREHGVRRLLVEGGGDLLAQLLEAGLLREMYVTLCPRIVGGHGAPSLVDGSGFPVPALPRLVLVAMERVGDELFLRYRVVPRAPAGTEGP